MIQGLQIITLNVKDVGKDKMFLKKRGRNAIGQLFPLMRRTRPRRCEVTGETQKYQTGYPPPWQNDHKDFNNSKKYPLEIDHKDMEEWRGVSSNLRWVTKLAHIELTKMHLFPYRRKIQKRAPTRKSGNYFSWE